jgi:hypothetical protein
METTYIIINPKTNSYFEGFFAGNTNQITWTDDYSEAVHYSSVEEIENANFYVKGDIHKVEHKISALARV